MRSFPIHHSSPRAHSRRCWVAAPVRRRGTIALPPGIRRPAQLRELRGSHAAERLFLLTPSRRLKVARAPASPRASSEEVRQSGLRSNRGVLGPTRRHPAATVIAVIVAAGPYVRSETVGGVLAYPVWSAADAEEVRINRFRGATYGPAVTAARRGFAGLPWLPSGGGSETGQWPASLFHVFTWRARPASRRRAASGSRWRRARRTSASCSARARAASRPSSTPAARCGSSSARSRCR